VVRHRLSIEVVTGMPIAACTLPLRGTHETRWAYPREYVARRAAEGKSKREIMRCLKRYIAREIYRLLLVP
jgi:hypothetical protein